MRKAVGVWLRGTGRAASTAGGIQCTWRPGVRKAGCSLRPVGPDVAHAISASLSPSSCGACHFCVPLPRLGPSSCLHSRSPREAKAERQRGALVGAPRHGRNGGADQAAVPPNAGPERMSTCLVTERHIISSGGPKDHPVGAHQRHDPPGECPPGECPPGECPPDGRPRPFLRSSE